MKKLFFLITLMVSSLGFSQTPTTAAPTPPTRAASDVYSIYSDAYTVIGGTGVEINPNWGQSGSATVATIAGNATLMYSNFNYQGTNFGTNLDVSGMEYLHVDIWTNAQAPKVYVISSGAEIGHSIASVAGSWQSLDFPISGLTGNASNVYQFKFDSGTGGTIYLDNLYFYKAATLPTADATLSDLKLDGTTITDFASGTIAYAKNFTIGTTTIPQITAATTTQSAATYVITQAAGIPGSATVKVTAQNGTTIKTYTVSFTATLPNPSPKPTTPAAEVLNIYSDTGDFTNNWTPSYSFGAYDSTPDLDLTTGVNNAIKMNFAAQGYGQGTDVTTNISAYNYVHFDYFVPSDQVPGVSGDQVRFILIGNAGVGAGEYYYEMTPAGSDGTLVKGSWQSVSVPLSVFTAKGFSKTNFLQYKLGTASDLYTKIVYFDNIYFSVNLPTSLGTTKFDSTISNLKLYPNPVKNSFTIEASASISKVSIYTLLGQEVLTASPKSNSATIQTSSLSKGVYIVKTEIDGNTSTSKFVKE